MNDTVQELMRAATRLTQSGRLREATEAIQRALGRAAPLDATPRPPLETPHAEGEATRLRLTAEPWAAPTGAGEFTSGTHTQGSLTRAYKLYVPPGAAGRQRPLVVMLHGCTQNPDDFAAGTAMNERAREQGFLVLYPAQSQQANPSRCWNWFKHNHQQRGSGEPAVLAGMTQAVMKQHDIDPRRVYIAGLSAGGAMAAIVAAAYPDLFAAVGVHSGLAPGAARSVSEALALMQTGVAQGGLQGGGRHVGAAPMAPLSHPVPTIVFHGDADRTVHPSNGDQVIAAVRGAGSAGRAVEQGVCRQGRRHTRTAHAAESGEAVAEHWLLHGAGHAWSGGQAGGSYTDAKGPDATREMLRFFFDHPLRMP